MIRNILSIIIILCLGISSRAQVVSSNMENISRTASAYELKFNSSKPSWEEINAAFENANTPFYPIDHAQWPDRNTGYNPFSAFRIAYSDVNREIYIQYKVAEKCVRATFGEDVVAQPWTDTCLEFFCIPGNDQMYYNLELNCIGIGILGSGVDRKDRVRAEKETLALIRRHSTLGSEPFGNREANGTLIEYTMTVAIPYEAYFRSEVKPLKGRSIRANFYHCGDNTPYPHYMSWNPILLEKPNFHTPEFFGSVEFK